MRRIAIVFLALVAACGGGTVGADTTAATTTAAPDIGGALPTTSEAPAATAPVEPEGDPAPDFLLELGDGGTFVLSAEEKPVYMVFWAEW